MIPLFPIQNFSRLFFRMENRNFQSKNKVFKKNYHFNHIPKQTAGEKIKT